MIVRAQYRVWILGLMCCFSVVGMGERRAWGQTGPVNDDCVSAEPISDVGVFAFDNRLAVLDGPDHAACVFAEDAQIDQDVWFCWTAPNATCTTDYVVETCGETAVDTTLAVYEGCSCPPTDATLLECSDDDCGSKGFQTRVSIAAVGGQQYLIRVGTYPGRLAGTGAINIQCSGVPDNDDCANAEPIADEGLFDFDTSLATTDGDSHVDCIYASEDQIIQDVWFCWEAPCDGTVFAETCDLTEVDTKVAVFDGCACPGTDENLLACNDDRCGPLFLQSRAAFEAIAGQNYLVRVGAWPDAPTPEQRGGLGSLRFTCGRDVCPSVGSCFDVHATAGCDDEDCCERVCEIDSFCCSVEWDDVCGGEAEGLCSGNFEACAQPGTLDCDIESTTPGCADADCCNTVCSEDPSCCLGVWDRLCADAEPILCRSACGPGAGGCHAANGSPGCQNEECCAEICQRDSFCCQGIADWDGTCAALAATYCQSTPGCPAGTVAWVDPPDGVVDARYAADPDTGLPLGIDMFLIEAPAGAAPACFSLCETVSASSPNAIDEVLEDASGGDVSTYTIKLARPITPAAVTTITYTDDQNGTTTAQFTAHPSNVNGDTLARAPDVLSTIDFLNGVDVAASAPWGVYSADVDRSGVAGASDVLAVIDLLNGAGAFDPWSNTALPTNEGICP